MVWDFVYEFFNFEFGLDVGMILVIISFVFGIIGGFVFFIRGVVGFFGIFGLIGIRVVKVVIKSCYFGWVD